MNNFIPIYYHIPKCGGTYFYYMMVNISQTIYPQGVYCIHIYDKIDIAFRLIVLDQSLGTTTLEPYLKQQNQKIFDASIDDIDHIFNRFYKNISLILVCSRGFQKFSIISEQFKRLNLQMKYYITIREIYSRLKSLYNYLSHEKSNHEKINFENYNNFDKLIVRESNWITSNIISLKKIGPEYEDYLLAIDVLKNFYVKDLSNIDDIIIDIYHNLYHFNGNIFSLIEQFKLNATKNESVINDNLNFQNLPNETKLNFLKYHDLDRNLYAYFTQI